jgi:Uma2 family endonuclease
VVQSNAMLDPTPLLASEKQRRLKRSEFQELVRLGAFDDERVELLYGVIVEMTSGDPEHAHPIQELTRLLLPQLLDRAVVRVQLDYLAAGESEPVPDIAIVPLANYRHAHPDRAHCIIEVAYSSVKKDRLLKMPDGSRYRSETRYGVGDVVALEAFPDVTVSVAELFG